MKFALPLALANGAVVLFAASAATAQGITPRGEAEPDLPEPAGIGFSWEGEIEIGVEDLYRSDDPDAELSNPYGIFSLAFGYGFANGIEVFGALTAESLDDPTPDDHVFQAMGLYVEELGLSFPVGQATTVSVGKLHPLFGTAWDDAAGYFGSSLAEDYELIEQIGAIADITLSDASVLSFAAFYADNTVLSESVGFRRPRNSTADGGAGNTGKLNNFALQWSSDVGERTFIKLGARYLSKGTGDFGDETGAVVSLGHSFAGAPLDVFAEVAAFNNYGGSSDDATYATLNAAYAIGDLTISGTLATRDLETEGNTDLASVGVEYEFANGFTLGGALAYVDEAGVKNQVLGVNLIIPLGG